MKIFLMALAFAVGLVSCTHDGKWKVYNSKNTVMTMDAVRQVAIENGKLAWVGTFGGGLYAVKGDQWVKSDRPALSHYILALRQDGFGRLWAGTSDGALVYDGKDWKRYSRADGFLDDNVWDICPDGDRVYVGMRYAGLCVIEKGVVRCLDRVAAGLPDRKVTIVVKDGQGVLWVGTEQAGLCGLENEKPVQLYNRANGLSGNYIRALICDEMKPRYCGTWDGGLDEFDGKVWTHINAVPPPVTSLTVDPQGRLWVGTWGGGVFYQSRTGWTDITDRNSGLPDNHVTDIRFTDAGEACIATGQGLAVFKYPEK
ncbi:MAG: two-component regulator propeller domain-containing protein [Fibrobacterota bacterium]